MIRYVIKRLLILIPILLGVIFIVFFIVSLTPSSPGRIILGIKGTQEAVDQLNESLGYNRPFLVRYLTYVGDVFRLDFGDSYLSGKPVVQELFARFPTTLFLSACMVIFGSMLGISLGVLSAVKQYSFIDSSCTVMALLFASIPSFWFGLMSIWLFAIELGWLPASGKETAAGWVLPIAVGSLSLMSALLRMTRTTMLESIRADYIRTARAKGASEKTVIWRHALKNAMVPVVTMMGAYFGSCLGGAVLIESVFGLPGIGSYIIMAITKKDVPVICGGTLLIASSFCLVILLVDLLYAFIDPRVKSKYVG